MWLIWNIPSSGSAALAAGRPRRRCVVDVAVFGTSPGIWPASCSQGSRMHFHRKLFNYVGRRRLKLLKSPGRSVAPPGNECRLSSRSDAGHASLRRMMLASKSYNYTQSTGSWTIPRNELLHGPTVMKRVSLAATIRPYSPHSAVQGFKKHWYVSAREWL